MNPFDGLHPSWGPFAPILESKVAMGLALIWAGAFAYTAYHFVVGTAKLAKARVQHRANDYEEAKGDLFWPAVATILLGSVPVIYAILIR